MNTTIGGVILQLFLWALLFIGYFGVTSFYLVRKNISYTSRPLLFLTITLIGIIMSIVLWSSWLIPVWNTQPFLIVAVIGESIALLIVGKVLYSRYRHNEILKKNSTVAMHGMQINDSYLYTKAAEIMYQQLYIFLMVAFIQHWASDLSTQVLMGAAIFGISHVPIVFVMVDKRNALTIIIGALIFGALVAAFYHAFGFQGVLVSYAIHYGVYLLAPMGFLIAKRFGITLSLDKKTELFSA